MSQALEFSSVGAYVLLAEHREKVRLAVVPDGFGDRADPSQNGYTCHHVHVYGFEREQERVIVEDCTIWIGRLDNPAFGESILIMSIGHIIVLTDSSRV